jgi:hypothetical protein
VRVSLGGVCGGRSWAVGCGLGEIIGLRGAQDDRMRDYVAQRVEVDVEGRKCERARTS